MNLWLYIALILVAMAIDLVGGGAIARALGRPRLCDCGRRKFPWLPLLHDIPPLLAFTPVAAALVLIGGILFRDLAIIIWWAWWTFYYTVRYVVHERDKITRFLKEAGRVVVRANGRLGVEHR